ncbi:hypothetical protein BS17DRAFT_201294 [Gyrodon lividus]|nr:hypothetical protein BS17DRAFT_201294 [Gyrodon lividus]
MSGLAYYLPEDEDEEPGPSSGAVQWNTDANHTRHGGLYPNGRPNWAPGPSPNDPGDLTADDFYAPPHNANMRHPNHSVPSLPSERPPEYDDIYEHVAPLPSIHRDTSALVDNMNSMRISDPVPRGASAMSFSSDPIPRAGTSMSMQSPAYRGPPQLRYANTLPPAPNATLPLRARRPADPHYPADDAGVAYHQGQGQLYGGGDLSPNRSNMTCAEGGQPPQPGVETDIVSLSAYDDQGSAPSSTYPSSESSFPYSQHPPQNYPPRQFQPGWQGSEQTLVPNYGHPHPGPPRAVPQSSVTSS